ncbi:MAG: UDP-N-acetylmuramate dehydrogenase [Gallionella sp.]|nr:UDP-N-acetylmuramate dehydrogenase [Gallionella sp.]
MDRGLPLNTLPSVFCLLSSELRGKMCCDVPMSRHTSWRAGGVAERLYRPADIADLLVFLRGLPADESLHVVGLGSNLLVRDGGLRGTVLLLHGALGGLRLEADGSISPQGGGRGCKATEAATTTLYAEAGVPGAKLARFAALHDLRGAEFCAGIPGTVGGMLAMNAGCYGSEIWEKVLRVQTVTRCGELIERTPQDYEIGYRHVVRNQESGIRDQESSEFFVAAWLKFEAGDGAIARQEIKALLGKRIASQPLNLPNAGSVFRNPPGDHAARLIQQCGLKGRRIGGAQVSEKHANFIVNTGGATAADIENLINEVRAAVRQQTGIDLHPEVRIIGEAA